MLLRPPISTPTDPLLPYPTLFRSPVLERLRHRGARDLVRARPRLRRHPPARLSALDRFARNDDRDGKRRGAPRLVRNVVSRQIGGGEGRSEEHTSELQSLMRISYAVFCLKKKIDNKKRQYAN